MARNTPTPPIVGPIALSPLKNGMLLLGFFFFALCFWMPQFAILCVSIRLRFFFLPNLSLRTA